MQIMQLEAKGKMTASIRDAFEKLQLTQTSVAEISMHGDPFFASAGMQYNDKT